MPAKKAKKRKKFFTIKSKIVFVIVIIFILWNISPAQNLYQQEKEKQEIKREIAATQKELLAAKKEAERLKSDAYIEEQARKEFGLIKPGENPYIVIFPKFREE